MTYFVFCRLAQERAFAIPKREGKVAKNKLERERERDRERDRDRDRETDARWSKIAGFTRRVYVSARAYNACVCHSVCMRVSESDTVRQKGGMGWERVMGQRGGGGGEE